MCICVRLSEDLTTIHVYTCVLPNVWRMRGKSQAGLRVSLLNVVKFAAFVFVVVHEKKKRWREKVCCLKGVSNDA